MPQLNSNRAGWSTKVMYKAAQLRIAQIETPQA